VGSNICQALNNGTPGGNNGTPVGGGEGDGEPLGDFYSFPTVGQLGAATDEALRGMGFGYRAKFIAGSVAALASRARYQTLQSWGLGFLNWLNFHVKGPKTALHDVISCRSMPQASSCAFRVFHM